MTEHIYIVTAHRFGCNDLHSYVLGAWNKKAQAIKAAELEEEWRGLKYGCQVVEVLLDVSTKEPIRTDHKIIRNPVKLFESERNQ